MLKTFTGFKGSIAFAQVGDIQFVLMAKTPAQLSTLWTALLSEAGPLDPSGIKKAILIEANTLPTPKGLNPKAQGCEARATLGAANQTSPNPEGVASEPNTIDV